jgi:pimeloyl-[acyl-carrier protein] methyl ester esterase
MSALSSALCFSGWAQSHLSLQNILSNNFLVDYLDYSLFANYKSLVAKAKFVTNSPDIVMGWSLGGQIALRLLADKIIQTKLLVLLAPPFQMVKDARVQAGMPTKVAKDFYENLQKSPSDTLKKFSILTSLNDRNAKEISKTLDIANSNNCLSWLNELYNFSCFDLDFSQMPPTVYFHGKGDSVVNVAQSKYFEQKIPNIKIYLLDDCGHAPHISKQQFIIDTIKNAIS